MRKEADRGGGDIQTGCRDGQVYDDEVVMIIPAIWPWDGFLTVILNKDKNWQDPSVAGTIHTHFHYPLTVAKRAKTLPFSPSFPNDLTWLERNRAPFNNFA